MVRWLQATVQGMLNPETADDRIAIVDAAFSRHGDARHVWTQTARSADVEIVLNWSRTIDPLLMAHDRPARLPDRKYDASVVMIPVRAAGMTLNGRAARGRAWPCTYDGQPFSTACLAFAESWREDPGG